MQQDAIMRHDSLSPVMDAQWHQGACCKLAPSLVGALLARLNFCASDLDCMMRRTHKEQEAQDRMENFL
jgi:hypothetical protein